MSETGGRRGVDILDSHSSLIAGKPVTSVAATHFSYIVSGKQSNRTHVRLSGRSTYRCHKGHLVLHARIRHIPSLQYVLLYQLLATCNAMCTR